jgi:hypothetical protein
MMQRGDEQDTHKSTIFSWGMSAYVTSATCPPFSGQYFSLGWFTAAWTTAFRSRLTVSVAISI